MANNRSSRGMTRTPRKSKIWAGAHGFLDLTSIPASVDLLDATFSDVGMTNPSGGVTVMRCVGQLQLVLWTASASTAAYSEVRVGAVWLPAREVSAGGSSLPDPLQDGVRQARWYQQWNLGGQETSSTPITGSVVEPIEMSLIKDIDVTNMQTQPTVDSRFMLIATQDGTYEADTIRLRYDLDFMLALP